MIRAMPARGLAVGAIGLLGASIAGYCGAWLWFLDLLAHFRPQYFGGALVIAMVAVGLRYWRCAAVAVLAVAVNIPAFLAVPVAASPSSSSRSIVVATFNVYGRNKLLDVAPRFLATIRPDIVVFEEFRRKFVPGLDGLAADYPHRAVLFKNDNSDVVVISRFALIEPRLIESPNEWIRVFVARVAIDGSEYQLIGIHPPTPTSPVQAATRDRGIAIVADLVRNSKLPSIVLGDFNATPWSLPMRRLFAETNLRAGSVWPVLSFPSIRPWPLRIPIDHVLVSPELGIDNVAKAAPTGSDHIPLVARIRLP